MRCDVLEAREFGQGGDRCRIGRGIGEGGRRRHAGDHATRQVHDALELRTNGAVERDGLVRRDPRRSRRASGPRHRPGPAPSAARRGQRCRRTRCRPSGGSSRTAAGATRRSRPASRRACGGERCARARPISGTRPPHPVLGSGLLGTGQDSRYDAIMGRTVPCWCPPCWLVPYPNAPVAQRIRASDFGSEGRGFESLRARHNNLRAARGPGRSHRPPASGVTETIERPTDGDALVDRVEQVGLRLPKVGGGSTSRRAPAATPPPVSRSGRPGCRVDGRRDHARRCPRRSR